MNEVWIVAERQRKTYDHGDFGDNWKLPTTGPYDSGPPHPAFPTEEAARKYIEQQQLSRMTHPVRLEFRIFAAKSSARRWVYLLRY